MNDQDLIKKIKLLKSIKPKVQWVILAKSEIMKEEAAASYGKFSVKSAWEAFNLFTSHKYAFASFVALLVFVGTFGLSQRAMPGDTLFTLRKALEQSQMMLLSETEQSKFNLEQANNRLEDLAKIARENKTKKLGAAINEYKASVSEVAKSLSKETDTAKIKEIALEVKKLEIKENEIKSLGVEMEQNVDLDSAIVETIIKETMNLRSQPLSDNQKAILDRVEKECLEKNYAAALDDILTVSNSGAKPEGDAVVPEGDAVVIEESVPATGD